MSVKKHFYSFDLIVTNLGICLLIFFIYLMRTNIAYELAV
jgi:hypothetical protein